MKYGEPRPACLSLLPVSRRSRSAGQSTATWYFGGSQASTGCHDILRDETDKNKEAKEKKKETRKKKKPAAKNMTRVRNSSNGLFCYRRRTTVEICHTETCRGTTVPNRLVFCPLSIIPRADRKRLATAQQPARPFHPSRWRCPFTSLFFAHPFLFDTRLFYWAPFSVQYFTDRQGKSPTPNAQCLPRRTRPRHPD